MFGPSFIATPVGAYCGARKYYVNSRKQDLFTNSVETGIGMVAGATVGLTVGILYPVTLPVFMYVAVCRYIDNKNE